MLTTHNPDKTLRVRPRFEWHSTRSVEQLSLKLNSSIQQHSASIQGKIKNGFGTLSLPPDKQHYWSPQLSLQLETTQEGTKVRGLYGPRPAVWTLFLFLYTILGFALMITFMLSYTYMTLDKETNLWWACPILLAAIMFLYAIAQTGKKLAHNQTEELHNFIVETLR